MVPLLALARGHGRLELRVHLEAIVLKESLPVSLGQKVDVLDHRLQVVQCFPSRRVDAAARNPVPFALEFDILLGPKQAQQLDLFRTARAAIVKVGPKGGIFGLVFADADAEPEPAALRMEGCTSLVRAQ